MKKPTYEHSLKFKVNKKNMVTVISAWLQDVSLFGASLFICKGQSSDVGDAASCCLL